ncbi:MAG: hypothetical protein WA990_06335 [Rubrobacteraceae bacterium]
MPLGNSISSIFVYGAALWLGFYLIGRDPRSPRLVLTGLGLIAYALAVASDLLGNTVLSSLESVTWPLLFLPALFWTGTLVYLLPEEVAFRGRLVRTWGIVAPTILLAMFLLASFSGRSFIGTAGESAGVSGIQAAFSVAAILPMLGLGYLVWRYLKKYRTGAVAGVLVVFTLFLALSTVLILFPLGWLPQTWALLAASIDVIALGLAIAYYDAFDQGEALMPDMVRSFDAALVAGVVFGGQVALAILLSPGPNAPLLPLLLAVLATSIAAATLSDRISAALDRIAFGRLPFVRRNRAELRETARSLQRRDPALDPSDLEEAEFVRLTRRALGNFGDLPRLSASPLINLKLVKERLAVRGATDDPLERAAELKSILSESISRLKPRTGADFGTSDEWRYYTALYFPYVVGLKPYSNRDRTGRKDPVAREALDWFRSSVPERTLYNWQNTAAKLVAQDLLSQSESTIK